MVIKGDAGSLDYSPCRPVLGDSWQTCRGAFWMNAELIQEALDAGTVKDICKGIHQLLWYPILP